MSKQAMKSKHPRSDEANDVALDIVLKHFYGDVSQEAKARVKAFGEHILGVTSETTDEEYVRALHRSIGITDHEWDRLRDEAGWYAYDVAGEATGIYPETNAELDEALKNRKYAKVFERAQGKAEVALIREHLDSLVEAVDHGRAS